MATDFEIQVNDTELNRQLALLSGRTGNLKPVFSVIGEILKTSIVKNFEVGGRYSAPGSWRGGSNRWQPLSPITIARKGHDRILFGEGHLMNSINYQADKDGVAVGTNLIYAAIHNFGGMAGRGHKVKIPARPYLVVQDEDMTEIKAVINDFLMEGLVA